MKTHFLKGSKQEIVDGLARIAGEVVEAIVFEAETSPADTVSGETDDLFAEMRPFMVTSPGLDDSRESIYSRHPGE